jgi:guanylate cyclase, other
MLETGTLNFYMKEFGQHFVRYFIQFDLFKIIRVAGRTFRDFLFAIDQLHESNRYTFPNMHSPLFLVTDENESGATLVYR